MNKNTIGWTAIGICLALALTMIIALPLIIDYRTASMQCGLLCFQTGDYDDWKYTMFNDENCHCIKGNTTYTFYEVVERAWEEKKLV